MFLRLRAVDEAGYQWRSRYSTAMTIIAKKMRKISVIASISLMTVPTAPKQIKRG